MTSASLDPNLHHLQSAREHIENGRLHEAALLLNQARQQAPEDPRVFMMAGLMSEKAGNSAGALQLMQKGLELAPHWAPGRIEFAQMLVRQSRTAEAMVMAEEALAMSPADRSNWDGAIAVFALAGNAAGTLSLFQRAVDAFPEDRTLRQGLASHLGGAGDYAQALENWNTLIAEAPHDAQALQGRVRTLIAAGRAQEAQVDTAQLLQWEPDNQVYIFYHARANGQTPQHQPTEINRSIFNATATVFEQQLVNRLHYFLPQKVAEKISQLHPKKRINILDLGCGTGLLGKHLGTVTGDFVGVDISAKMMEEAQRLKTYTSLLNVDLRQALDQSPPDHYNIVTALDVYIYAGALQDTLAGIWRALKPQGHFMVSCETAPEDGPDLVLHPTNDRYAHKCSHVQRLCEEAGFRSVSVEQITLRHEKGQPVEGFLVTARK
jgi:predicted TPR repeat methyltransferase